MQDMRNIHQEYCRLSTAVSSGIRKKHSNCPILQGLYTSAYTRSLRTTVQILPFIDSVQCTMCCTINCQSAHVPSRTAQFKITAHTPLRCQGCAAHSNYTDKQSPFRSRKIHSLFISHSQGNPSDSQTHQKPMMCINTPHSLMYTCTYLQGAIRVYCSCLQLKSLRLSLSHHRDLAPC